MKINIKQEPTNLGERELDRYSHVVMLVPDTGPLPELPHAKSIRTQLQRQRNKEADRVVCDLPTATTTRAVILRVKNNPSAFELLALARRGVAPLLEQDPAQIAIAAHSLDDPRGRRAVEAVVAALLAGSCALPSFKRIAAATPRLRTIHVYHRTEVDLSLTTAGAEGNNLARTLTILPANELTPTLYRKRVAQLARDEDWKLDFLDQATLRRKHAGAFLAVAQGSPQADAGILHLRYQPARRTRKPALALVGKGICFDTGGMNLKPARHMHGMHEDMAGSAVALGTLLALSRLKVDFPVDCWLALAQNHIGPNAYKQNDVVRAANGISIEVVHTDAEGRMVLADTLYLASRGRPALLLNYATLTGSCIQALGTNYSGVFTTDERLRNAAIAAGRDSGERVWPFPMDGDYDALLESQIADIKQCTLDNEADHILAARFLTRFVDPAVRWLHVDLSAVNRKGGLAHVPTDTTGFGVRFTLELLLRRHALAAI